MLTVLALKWFDTLGRHNHLFIYTAEYVNRLRSMLARHLTLPHELVCCTDDPSGIDPRIRIVPLPAAVKSLGNEFPKLYAFHHDAARLFGPRILLIDLDVVIVGNIDHLVDRPEPFVAWAGIAGRPNRFNTSLVLMDGGAFPEVWMRFDRAASLAELNAAGYEGWEQDWVSHVVGARGATWPRSGASIESFGAVRLRMLPSSARIVFFNGRSSPAMARCRQDAHWIVKHWR